VGITSGDETQWVDEAIHRTAQFFESFGIKTHPPTATRGLTTSRH